MSEAPKLLYSSRLRRNHLQMRTPAATTRPSRDAGHQDPRSRSGIVCVDSLHVSLVVGTLVDLPALNKLLRKPKSGCPFAGEVGNEGTTFQRNLDPCFWRPILWCCAWFKVHLHQFHPSLSKVTRNKEHDKAKIVDQQEKFSPTSGSSLDEFEAFFGSSVRTQRRVAF